MYSRREINDLFYVLVSIMLRKKNKENDRLRNRYDGKTRERGKEKKVVLVVRFIHRRVSCIYDRSTKKEKKKACAMHFANPRLHVMEGQMKENKTTMACLIETKF